MLMQANVGPVAILEFGLTVSAIPPAYRSTSKIELKFKINLKSLPKKF